MVARLFTDEISWDLKRGCFFKHELKVGDELEFIPSMTIDHFRESVTMEYTLTHLVHNVYEFNFRVAKRFYNDQNDNCFHYVIEIKPGLRLFHFNWDKDYREYLKVGKWYWGYGRITSCGDPSMENPFVDPLDIKHITNKGTIERILVVHNNRSYFENRCPWIPGEVYTGECPLEKLGYPQDYNRFKDSLSKKLPKPKEVESTSQKDTYDVLNFSMIY